MLIKKLTTALVFMLIIQLAYTQDVKTSFKQLQSIIGTWIMDSRRGPQYETWKKETDSTLIGKSYRIINNTDTLVLEDMNISIKGNTINYTTMIQGQHNNLPVVFKLIRVKNETFTFDNPQHDFPQQVVYQLLKNDQLHAWIEGMDMGVYKKVDFPYKKLK